MVLESRACHRSYNRICYAFEGPPHADLKTSHRVLGCSGTHINLLQDPDGSISKMQSGAYLEEQFHQSLRRAYNPKRQYQCQSIIISFSKSEFDTGNLNEQSQQALSLVQGFVHQYFGDTQSVTCIQCDGTGSCNDGDGKLHAHLLINVVNRSGKTIATNRFTVFHLRKIFNDYLEQNFEKVTGHKWNNPFDNVNKTRRDVNKLVTKSAWNKHLKKIIDVVKTQTSNSDEFKSNLKQYGIRITERQKGRAWTYHQEVQTAKGIKQLKVRDFYQRVDKNTGAVLSTRGLGISYTKESLEKYWRQRQNEEVMEVPSKVVKKNQQRKDDSNVKNASKSFNIVQFENEIKRQRRYQERVVQQQRSPETQEDVDEHAAQPKYQRRQQESRKSAEPVDDSKASQGAGQQARFKEVNGVHQSGGPEPGE